MEFSLLKLKRCKRLTHPEASSRKTFCRPSPGLRLWLWGGAAWTFVSLQLQLFASGSEPRHPNASLPHSAGVLWPSRKLAEVVPTLHCCA